MKDLEWCFKLNDQREKWVESGQTRVKIMCSTGHVKRGLGVRQYGAGVMWSDE